MFTDPHAQNILVAVKIDTNYQVNSLVDNMTFLLDLVVDGIQKHHSVSSLQRPGLPFPDKRYDLVGDVGYQRRRYLYVAGLDEPECPAPSPVAIPLSVPGFVLCLIVSFCITFPYFISLSSERHFILQTH